MKKVSELLEEQKRDHSQAHLAAKQELERNCKWMDELDKADIPVYVHKETWTNKTDYQVVRNGLREQVRQGNIIRLSLACDGCGTEIVNREPGSITLSDPPQIYVGCPGCGWISSIPMGPSQPPRIFFTCKKEE